MQVAFCVLTYRNLGRTLPPNIQLALTTELRSLYQSWHTLFSVKKNKAKKRKPMQVTTTSYFFVSKRTKLDDRANWFSGGPFRNTGNVDQVRNVELFLQFNNMVALDVERSRFKGGGKGFLKYAFCRSVFMFYRRSWWAMNAGGLSFHLFLWTYTLRKFKKRCR